MNSVQECTCRALDKKGREKPLIIVADPATIAQVRAMVGISVPPESVCFGSTWTTPDGKMITVARYDEDPHTAGFDLEVCNGGKVLTEDHRKDLARWRNAAK